MDANKIIDALGGTVVVAGMFEITAGAVSQWRATNEIPKARLMYLRLARPDVFIGAPPVDPKPITRAV